jgi:hypothetical protein
MNFTQMHERLRLELLRRIGRGSLSVSLLARQTGFGESHISNFLNSRRRLSMEAVDRVLASQSIPAADLLPTAHRGGLAVEGENTSVPVVSHAAALFEPYIRPSAIHSMLRLPDGILQAQRGRASQHRQKWQRFVAVSIPSADSLPMEPILLPNAIVLLDRHYNSLMAYRPERPSLYAVRHGAHLAVRYVDFLLNRLVLRPYNPSFPVELVEVALGETPNDLIAGRVVLIINEY